MKEFQLTFTNDYLLLDSITSKAGFVTTNDILLERKEIVILSNDTLNLYTALVKRIDFTRKKLVGALPFFIMKTTDVLEFLPSSYKTDFYWKLRKAFSFYNNRKRIGRTESFRLWFKKESFPATLIRLIAKISSSNKEEELETLSELISKVQFVDNFQSMGRIYLPKTVSELGNPKLAYLIGCANGDGGFCLDDYWLLVDGDKSGQLKYSYEYFEKIKKVLNSIFNIKFSSNNPRRRENRLDLWIANKWFGRFLNFFFGLPYGKRKNIIEPKIFELFSNVEEFNKLFLRGLFDSEGSCGDIGNISISSSDHKFLEDCKNTLLEFNIKTGEILGNNLHIRSESCINFAQNIGFSHPKKLKNLLYFLQIGSRETKFVELKKDLILHERFYDLRRINGLYVYGLDKYFRHIRTNLDLFQKNIASKLGVTKNTIFDWENGSGIPFTKLCKLWELKRENLDNLFEFLSKKDLRWGLNGRGQKRIKLPIEVDEMTIEIANLVRPYVDDLRVLKTGHNIEVFDSIKNKFDVKVVEIRDGVFEVLSKTLSHFFSEFFEYKLYWYPLGKEEIKGVENKLTQIWN